MADTTIHSDLTIEQWADSEMYVYVRKDSFSKFQGTDETSIIQVKEDLTTKAGNSIWFQLIMKLSGAETVDDDTLEGGEENLANYGMNVVVHQIRHAVVIGGHEEIKTNIDMAKASKIMLRLWLSEKLHQLRLARWFSPCVDGLTTYSAATVAQRNAWAVTNNPAVSNQRILYGAAKSNYSGVHATDLANIDGTADDLHQDMLSLLKRMAQGCSPLVRPWTSVDSEGVGRDGYVCVVGSLPFRDLEANFASTEGLVSARGPGNRIFAGGNLTIGNVLVVEDPEMDKTPANGGCLLENVGNGGTVAVEPVFFVGAQSLLHAVAKRLSIKTKDFDYGNKHGVAVAETRGCAKATFNNVQHGTVTGFVSAVGD